MSSAISHSIEDYIQKALDEDADAISDTMHYAKLSVFDENSSKSGIILKPENSTEDDDSEGCNNDMIQLANIAFACVIHGPQSALGQYAFSFNEELVLMGL